MTADPQLLETALRENVFLATPTSLMSILRTIYNVWQMQNRQKNAEEIAERAGRLYEKVVLFLDDMSRVDANLQRARSAFDNAKQKLSLGQGNVVRQIEMLRDLGAKTSKRLPTQWNTSSEAGEATLDEGDESSLFGAADHDTEPEQAVVPLIPERKTSGGLF
jgi:DNA recombination protein RmuC